MDIILRLKKIRRQLFPGRSAVRVSSLLVGVLLFALVAANLALAKRFLIDDISREQDVLNEALVLKTLSRQMNSLPIKLYDRNEPALQALLREAETSSNYNLHRYLGDIFKNNPDFHSLAVQQYRMALDDTEHTADGVTPGGGPPRCPHIGLGTLLFQRGDLRAPQRSTSRPTSITRAATMR